jgi:hypothetical protein
MGSRLPGHFLATERGSRRTLGKLVARDIKSSRFTCAVILFAISPSVRGSGGRFSGLDSTRGRFPLDPTEEPPNIARRPDEIMLQPHLGLSTIAGMAQAIAAHQFALGNPGRRCVLGALGGGPPAFCRKPLRERGRMRATGRRPEITVETKGGGEGINAKTPRRGDSQRGNIQNGRR